eukprot:9308245-Lingulodinium_polyedra.AAC.1
MKVVSPRRGCIAEHVCSTVLASCSCRVGPFSPAMPGRCLANIEFAYARDVVARGGFSGLDQLQVLYAGLELAMT